MVVVKIEQPCVSPASGGCARRDIGAETATTLEDHTLDFR